MSLHAMIYIMCKAHSEETVPFEVPLLTTDLVNKKHSPILNLVTSFDKRVPKRAIIKF